jgi:hypothetical protein
VDRTFLDACVTYIDIGRQYTPPSPRPMCSCGGDAV